MILPMAPAPIIRHRVRPIDPNSPAEVDLVASRMRQTLVEVLGEEVGGPMYTMEWLIQRVRWHLDPEQCVGQVFVSENGDGQITGHTIVRIEHDDDGQPFGLFSTFYVEPGSRRRGVAASFVDRGEAWMRGHSLTVARTYTAATNARLTGFLARLGYEKTATSGDMIILSKTLVTSDAPP